MIRNGILALALALTLAGSADAKQRPENGIWNKDVVSTKISPQRENVVRTLNRGLFGTPMAWTGRELEAAGWKHHVHPAFIAAIAGTEASFGEASCSGNPKNAFGLSSCDSGWRVPYFQTWAQAYTFMAIFLRERWASARTPWDFHGYAACSSCWGSKVAFWMKHRFGFPATVSYH